MRKERECEKEEKNRRETNFFVAAIKSFGL
jgi:hypothetical protein